MVAINPSEYCGITHDQLSGTFLAAWGLDATAQLATGQVITAPVASVIDLNTGIDVSTALLSGTPSIGPNAANLAGQVVTQAITAAVVGHTYRLRIDYVPSPPSPAGQKLALVLDLKIDE